MRKLSNIKPSVIATLSNKRMREIIRKSEFLVSTQLDNLKAIDARATQIMTSLGLILSVIIGVFVISDIEVESKLNLLFKIIFITAGISTIVCLQYCLRIIQSDEICPPGNDGVELLGDASDKFSEHEENLDYILVLSESRHRNEKLIKRNAKFLKLGSLCFIISVSLVLFAGGIIIWFR